MSLDMNKHTKTNVQKRFFTLVAIATSSTALISGCAPAFNPNSKLIAQSTEGAVACNSFKDDLFDALYVSLRSPAGAPSSNDFKQSLKDLTTTERWKKVSKNTKTELLDEVVSLYETLTEKITAQPELKDNYNHIKMLSALELGDQSSGLKKNLQELIQSKTARIKSITKDSGLSCSQTPPETQTPGDSNGSSGTPPDAGAGTGETSAARDIGLDGDTNPSPLLAKWKQTRAPVVYGALKSMAVAYQSCDAADRRPAMSQASADVAGITIVGNHSSGTGKVREITDVAALVRTHWYYSSYIKPKPTGCFDALKKPLIYDYGGKPYSTVGTDSTLDMFKNAGSGASNTLGIDCSALVYSSLAASGRKLKTDGRLKAIGIEGLSSTMMMDPAANGLSCLKHFKVSIKKSVQPGDIIAIRGHVVLVESAGDDPFGLERAQTLASCEALSVAGFNFVILQSSPSNGGIGINRYQANDYLAGAAAMKTGLLNLAKGACRAKFGKAVPSSVNSDASIIRHAGSAQCLDRPVRLASESCIDSCQ
jgi:hypothetical protein